jgi:Flp pilus assembly protein TadD
MYHSHALGPDWDQSLAQRVVIAGKAIWFYLGKLVWPHPLIFIYPRWQIDAANPIAYLPVLAAIGGIFLLWWKRNTNHRYLFFAAAYFVTALFPVLGFFNVYFFRFSFVGDHFQYLASMGPIALAGAGIKEVFDFFRKRTAIITPIVFGTLLSGLGLLTWQQCALYANEETLYRVTISLNPSSTLARANLGALLLDQHPDEALVQMQEYLKLDPKSPESHNSLGLALEFTGRFDQAVTRYKEALELNQNYVEAHDNLGRTYERMGRLDEAIAQYQTTLRLTPDDPGVHGNLGTAFEQLGRFEEAAAQYRESIRLKPDFPAMYNNLGQVLGKMGHPDEAIAQFNEALRLNPNFAEAHNNLGITFERLGRLTDAAKEYSEALRLDPSSTEAATNLSRVVNLTKKRN